MVFLITGERNIPPAACPKLSTWYSPLVGTGGSSAEQANERHGPATTSGKKLGPRAPVPVRPFVEGVPCSHWQQEEPHKSHLGYHSSPAQAARSSTHSAFSQQLEVSQLEGSLQQPKAQSAMSPYLVPDTQALCHHLPVIRQLATSGRFIVIIPRTGKCIGEVGAESVAKRESGLGLRDPYLGPSLHTVALVKSCHLSELQSFHLRSGHDNPC